MTTVVLVDDHQVLLSGFAMFLQNHGFEVLASLSKSAEVLATYQKLSPDILILDIRLGEDLTGLDLAKKILSFDPVAKIIFLSQFDQESLIKEAYRMGCYAFLPKSVDPQKLVSAIRRVAEGEIYFLPDIAKKLVELAINGDSSPQSLLDPRELEVFILMAKGRTNVEIAGKLSLSIKTISTISQSIKEKLGTQRVADLTLTAIRHGLIEP